MTDTLVQKVRKAKKVKIEEAQKAAPALIEKLEQENEKVAEEVKEIETVQARAKKKADAVPDKPEAPPKKKATWSAPVAPEKQPKAKLTGKLNTKVHRNGTAFTDKRPGVCAIIIEMWRKGSEKKPVTKDAVVAEIIKRLPDRDPAKTKSLVAGAPSWLLTYNGIQVKSAPTAEGRKGYWIPDSETEEVVAARLKKIREAAKAK